MSSNRTTEPQEFENEEWLDWEMRLVVEDGKSDSVLLDTDRGEDVWMQKAEVGYTENVEGILEALDGPLSIVHTVSPKEVTQCFKEWVPSLEKEIQSLEHAVDRVNSHDPGVRQDLESKRGQLIPMKVVFTVKPPDPPTDNSAPAAMYKRKSRIVICGNMASHQPGEVYTNTAPAEVVRAAFALATMFNWNLYSSSLSPDATEGAAKCSIGVRDTIQTGLCKQNELWRLTHAVYGPQESPKLWVRTEISDFGRSSWRSAVKRSLWCRARRNRRGGQLSKTKLNWWGF